MRYSAALATTLYGSALLLGQVYADAEDVISSASSGAEEIIASASEAVESATSSMVERPTFTVSIEESLSSLKLSSIGQILIPLCSRQTSRLHSSNNSPTTGLSDGLLLTQRRRTRRPMRNGPSLASGLSRSPQSSRESRATRVWSLRIRRPTTLSQPNSPRR